MNLIDCVDMAIVRRTDSSRWIALSYVWGKRPQAFVANTSFRVGSCLPSDLPRTVADAITATKLLGYRYLWVDEYCIDQSDTRHKTLQISRMDGIYSGADVTIVAAAGKDKSYGLPGVGLTERIPSAAIQVGDFTLFSNGPDPKKDITSSE